MWNEANGRAAASQPLTATETTTGVVPAPVEALLSAAAAPEDQDLEGLGSRSRVAGDGRRSLSSLGQVTAVTDPNGATSSYVYDEWGRQTKQILPDDTLAHPTVRTTYQNYLSSASPYAVKEERRDNASKDASGNPIAATYLESWTYYDGLGRAVQSQREASVSTQSIVASMRFTAQGLVARSNAPYYAAGGLGVYRTPDWSQAYSETVYDALGRVTQVIQPGNEQVCTFYQGLRTAVVNERNYQTIRETDSLGRLMSVKNYYGTVGAPGAVCPSPNWNALPNATTNYRYDVADRLTEVTDADGATTRIFYDLGGRKTEMRDPDMGTWSYGYDLAGNLKLQTDARGQTICFYYDALNRLMGKHGRADANCPAWNGGSVSPLLARFYYDESGYGSSRGRRSRAVAYVDGLANNTISWSYDARGRITSDTRQIDSVNYAMTYTYDAMDRVRTTRYPDGEVVTFTYTGQGPLRSVVGTSVYVGNTLYNALGQVTDRYLGSTAGVIRQQYGYTSAENFRLTTLKSGANNPGYNNLQNISYSYDDAGNVLTIADSAAYGGSQTQTFTYDALNRLLTACTLNGAACATADGSYGAYSQRSYVYNPAGNITTFEGATLGYNDAAHKHAVTHVAGTQRYWYDANGNATQRVNGSQDITLAYDAENRLISISGSGINATYVYDGDGKRVKATVGGVTTVYIGNYYERDNGATVRKYYYAGAVRVAMRTGGNTYYLLNDHLTSTAITTNSSGARLTELRYFAYGGTRYDAGSQMTLYRFTGQRVETGTGLYDYGARWYDPQIGRFLAADSIVTNPGDTSTGLSAGSQALNRYMYVLGNPVKYSDPSGHAACAANDRACWEHEWAWKDRWYKEHGYENINGRYIYTGNFVIENADALLRNDHVRRTMISNFAKDLIKNGTMAGEALARVTAYAAAFYKSFGAAINPFSMPQFVDDVSHVFTGMAGPDIGLDFITEARDTNPYFVDTDQFPDTDLKAIFQDGTANQPYHFWFYVAVSFWYGSNVAQAGNVFHESVPPQTGRSFQDLALGAMGVDLGRQLRSGFPIYAVSDWIRSRLMR